MSWFRKSSNESPLTPAMREAIDGFTEDLRDGILGPMPSFSLPDIARRIEALEKNSHPPFDFTDIVERVTKLESPQSPGTVTSGLQAEMDRCRERLMDLEDKALSGLDFTHNLNERLSTLEVKFEDLMSKLYAPGQAIAGLQVNMERCFGRVADLENNPSNLKLADKIADFVRKVSPLEEESESLLSAIKITQRRVFEFHLELKNLTNLIQQVMLVQNLEAVTVPTVPEVPEHIEVRKMPRVRP